MAVFLINASNIQKGGGGCQVTDSICRELPSFQEHTFIVVLSEGVSYLKTIVSARNIIVYSYNIGNSFKNIILGRDEFLDNLVLHHKVEAVLTIFGPSKWIPRCPHLCGFARAQIVLKDSPYLKRISWKTKIKFFIWKQAFKKSSRVFYTENEIISELLPSVLGKNIRVFTVTNYYNQIFEDKSLWRELRLPLFEGATFLTLASNYPHKNLTIAVLISKILKSKHPNFKFRFVFTIEQSSYISLDDSIKNNFVFIGNVDISECPHLYQQCSVVFNPSLMECFSATYPEAMKMGKPIVTTDLAFSRGLCGDAACYYSPIDAESAADALYKVSTNRKYSQYLVEQGKYRLNSFDNYEQRTKKLINIINILKDERNTN